MNSIQIKTAHGKVINALVGDTVVYSHKGKVKAGKIESFQSGLYVSGRDWPIKPGNCFWISAGVGYEL